MGGRGRGERRRPLEEEADDHEDGFADDVAGHLGFAVQAFGEDDGDFHDLHALPPDFMGHLDLKAVTIGMHGFQVNGFEGRGGGNI